MSALLYLRRAECTGWVGRGSKREHRYINSGARKAG